MSNVKENEVKSSGNQSGLLGRLDLWAIAVGLVIGSGIMSLPGSAIAMTGRSAWLAYFVAICIGVTLNIPFFFLASTVRLDGGQYTLCAVLGNKLVAGMFICINAASVISLGMLALALGSYVNTIFPVLSANGWAIISLTIVYIINMAGAKDMANAQKLMVYILIGSLVMFIAFGLPKVNPATFDFKDPLFLTGGMSSFIKVVAMFAYSTYGYYYVINYGRSAKDSKRDAPFAMFWTIPVIIFIYVGVTAVHAGVLPFDTVKGQFLTLTAREILPGPLFAVFIIGGAGMALATTLNSVMGSHGNLFLKACEDGWFPAALAKTNKKGVPYVIFTILYVIGLIPLVSGLSLVQIINNTALLTYVSLIAVYGSVWFLTDKYPEQWKRARLHVPDGIFKLSVIISFCSLFFLLYFASASLTPTVVGVSFSVVIFCIVYAYFRLKSGRVNILEGAYFEE